MKVKQLIKKLQVLPENAEIEICIEKEGYRTWYEVTEVEESTDKEHRLIFAGKETMWG